MDCGYLIIYEPDDCSHSHFKIVGGFNEIAAIHSFYSEYSERYSKVDIDDEMFYKLIRNLEFEDAIRLHNLIVPDIPITLVYSVGRKIFDECDKEAE